MLIGFVGIAHAGKDTAGAHLVLRHGFVHYSMAMPHIPFGTSRDFFVPFTP